MITAIWLFFMSHQLPAAPQIPAPQAPAAQAQTAVMTGTPTQNDQLGPGDTVHVTVWTGVEYQREDLTLAPDGSVFIPFFVNKLVNMSGLTSTQVRSLLLEELRKTYRDPVVQVIPSLVLQSKRALLVGDLGRSGYFPITSDTTVLEFVMANSGGGPNSNLTQVQVTRGSERIPVNILDLLMKPDAPGNIKMKSGDIVYVPSLQAVSNKIFVISEGRSISLLQTAEKLDLLEALARSGVAFSGSGLSGGSNSIGGAGSVGNNRLDAVYIIRSIVTNGKGVTEVTDVKFDSLYKHADLSVNVPLQNGDIIFMPKARLVRIQEVFGYLSPITSAIQTSLFFGAVF